MTADKKQALVSFIIPYHNEDTDMLIECIDSILALSLSNAEREIIIVDDGSDYCPMNELLRYGESIIYLRKPNGGLSTARNMGLRIAAGKYVQFVDSDDTLVPTEYDRCLDIARYSDPDMVMFDFTTKMHTPPQAVCDVQGPLTGAEYMRHNNLHAMACGYIFRKDLLLDLKFTSQLIHEDEEFTPQLVLRCDRLFVADVKAYFYRKREGSITNRKDEEWTERRLNDEEKIITRLYNMADSLPMQERLALQRRVHQLSMDYLYNTIVLTRSMKSLNERIEFLSKMGLFPLPDKNYTKKYIGFRKMINSSVGRRILLMTLPLMKK